MAAGFLYATWVLPVMLSLAGPADAHDQARDLFRLALNQDQLTPHEREEVESFYLKYEAIKNVLQEYETLKQIENANDLKRFMACKKKLLAKI